MANKFKLEFSGFEELSQRLQELDGDLRGVTEEALKNTHAYVTPKLRADMQKHKRTGETEKSIIDKPKVFWNGDVASIDVGFDITNGGLASIFLMHGTPRIRPDRKLYQDIYGNNTKKEIADIQEKTFLNAITKAVGG